MHWWLLVHFGPGKPVRSTGMDVWASVGRLFEF